MTPKRNDNTAPQDRPSAQMQVAVHVVAGMMTLPWAGDSTIDVDSGKIYAVSYGAHGKNLIRVSMENEARMDFEMDFGIFRAMLRDARAGAYVDFRAYQDSASTSPSSGPSGGQEPDDAPKKKGRFGAAFRRS